MPSIGRVRSEIQRPSIERMRKCAGFSWVRRETPRSSIGRARRETRKPSIGIFEQFLEAVSASSMDFLSFFLGFSLVFFFSSTGNFFVFGCPLGFFFWKELITGILDEILLGICYAGDSSNYF